MIDCSIILQEEFHWVPARIQITFQNSFRLNEIDCKEDRRCCSIMILQGNTYRVSVRNNFITAKHHYCRSKLSRFC